MSNAATVRAALKSAGFKPTRVTVRDNGGTTETSLTVTIRDASVSLSRVLELTRKFRNVRHDETTGETLAAGNTFIRVEYANAVVAPVAARIRAQIEPAADGAIVELDGGFSARKRERENCTYHYEVELSGPGLVDDAISVGLRFASERLAVAYLDAQASAASAA